MAVFALSMTLLFMIAAGYGARRHMIKLCRRYGEVRCGGQIYSLSPEGRLVWRDAVGVRDD